MNTLKKLQNYSNRFRERYAILWRFFAGLLGLLLVFVTGVILYMTVEGWNFLDSFYMVVITLSTVGYMEVQPLSDVGRLFTSFLILGGVGSFAYMVGAFTQVLVEGRLHDILGRHRMQKKIDKLSNHFIVCGYGRIGSVVAQQIQREDKPVVVIEMNPDLMDKLDEDGILYIQGDATSDESLIRAGILRADSLITALTKEAANVYVTLTARQINPELNIIARADEEIHIQRLERAGADRVVLPNFIGGMRMAQSVLKPTVTNFVELAMRGNVELQMEELRVGTTSELAGKELKNSGIRQRFNVIIIGIKKPDGTMTFNPGPDEIIEKKDMLLTVGDRENVDKLEAICQGAA